MEDSPLATIAKGAIYEIVATDGVATCTVINRSDVSAEEGALCAREMHDALQSLIAKDHTIVGIVMNVAEGPSVFGPKTREALEVLFRAAETARKRVAVRVGTAAIQHLQFTSLCRECAPTFGRVYEDERANDWARGTLA